LVVSFFAVFATSQFLPTQAADTGFLDIYDHIITLAAAIAALSNRYFFVTLCGLSGPFFHEGFLFVWLALAILVAWQGIDARRLVALSAPFLSTAIVYLLGNKEAGAAMISAAPVSNEMKDSFIAFQFSQTISSSLHILLWKFRYNFQNFLMAAMFFTSAGIAPRQFRPSRKAVLATASQFFWLCLVPRPS
jgi:hypothetical protein